MKPVTRLLATLLAAAALVLPARAEILERVLVKVNGEILTKTQLEERQIAALRQRNPQMRDEDVRNDAQLKKMLEEVTPDVLVDAIDEMLLLQRGKELGYKVSDEQFKRVLDNIRKENKLDNDEQFNAALKQEGITLEQLRKNLEKQMVINQVQQVEVAGKVGISESEAQASEPATRTHSMCYVCCGGLRPSSLPTDSLLSVQIRRPAR